MSLDTLTGTRSTQLVSLADFKISHDPGIRLASMPLGACLGVVIYEPALKLAGLLHSLLPSSAMDPARAEKFPAMFLDSGLAAMINQAAELHAAQDNLEIYVVGGAQVMDDSTHFNLAQRQYKALTTLLEQMGLKIQAQDVGGQANRSVQVDVDTGEVRLKLSGQSDLKSLCKR